ncbi:MAG: hypothetical protein M1822_007387 [Bathelium mastoideum]|nr:MAG: hypothetical protein M1822_007387 [Bathelium mastoideum]
MQGNKKNSSGESSNADNWFEKSNNNVSQGSNTFMDNDPPFFLRTGSSSDSPPEHQRHDSGPPASGLGRTLLQRSGVLRAGSQGGSSSEDFRSVIDDLTVENKKLKRRLKKYEKLHDAHLQDEKLFEVRIHGLPADKKRDLEETLKQFAISLDASPVSGSPVPGLDRFVPGLQSHKTASSSHTSNHQMADSAYASMSASGQGSSLPGHTSTGASNNQDRPAKGVAKLAKSRDANIHSYLHDIPEGLLPRRPPVMTERTKSKLVVRRLEQIFAGKGAATEGHQQPLQQQEVSQMAAWADRNEIEARGQQAGIEGLREAAIMLEETEDPMYFSNRKNQPGPDAERKTRPSLISSGQDSIEEPSPEQRPTRPLDLDPHRAQVPAENIGYIRHLGFSPPDLQTLSVPEDGHGWIYLNLLTNMAQLHTLNVTGDFVKKALTDFSSKFELSDDGRKVRWRGGLGISKTSSDGSSSAGQDPEAYYRSRESNRRAKRTKAKKSENQAITQSGSEGQQKSINTGASNYPVSYTPLFFHRENSDEEEESSYEDSGIEESPQPAYVTGDSSGLASSGMRTSSSRKKRDDGPIIFYNKARFCTDLSGDRNAAKDREYNAIDYQSVTPTVIGSEAYKRNRQSIESSRGPLSRAAQLPDPMDLDDNPIPADQELAFPHDSPVPSSRSGSRRSSPEPMDFEVSGLGGVCPDDNFEIIVKNRHVPRDEQTQHPQAAHGFAKQVYHHRLAAIIGASKRTSIPAIDEQIVGMKRKNLPPSSLPPAAYFPTESSPETDESDADSDVSREPDSPNRDVPATAPQPLTIPPASSEDESSEESESDDDDDESDDSVDLLAAAREIDPATVMAQEREYDSHVAERLAEEIPAGSSAATAGGGSGFNSPASVMAGTGGNSSDEDADSDEEVREARAPPASGRKGKAPPSLKRTRTGDSMVVHAKTPRLE